MARDLSYLEKWVRSKRQYSTLKNGSQWEKLVTLNKSGSRLEKAVTHLGNRILVRKIFHTWKNGSILKKAEIHLEKWVTLL